MLVRSELAVATRSLLGTQWVTRERHPGPAYESMAIRILQEPTWARQTRKAGDRSRPESCGGPRARSTALLAVGVPRVQSPENPVLALHWSQLCSCPVEVRSTRAPSSVLPVQMAAQTTGQHGRELPISLLPPRPGDTRLLSWVGHALSLGDGAQTRAASWTHHFGLEGRLDLPVLQLLPVDPAEEGVLPHVPLALGPTAQPLGGVLGHQLRREREGGWRRLPRDAGPFAWRCLQPCGADAGQPQEA